MFSFSRLEVRSFGPHLAVHDFSWYPQYPVVFAGLENPEKALWNEGRTEVAAVHGLWIHQDKDSFRHPSVFDQISVDQVCKVREEDASFFGECFA